MEEIENVCETKLAIIKDAKEDILKARNELKKVTESVNLIKKRLKEADNAMLKLLDCSKK